MRYVILRDDDTNTTTPVECLERLYRPFLERGLPVNLATIPAVNTDARKADGSPEGFLLGDHRSEGMKPLADNPQLVGYLKSNPGYRIVQHGCHHDFMEFDCREPGEAARRLEHGSACLRDAGFEKPEAFVAPYDRLSRASLREVATRFRVLSTGWFELGRLPYSWWPRYACKKLKQAPHWKVGRTVLLSHPGCLLSCHRAYATMMAGVTQCLEHNQLTVLVTHWWEYFRDNRADEPFIEFLHETASYISTHKDLKVISFSDLVNSAIPLN